MITRAPTTLNPLGTPIALYDNCTLLIAYARPASAGSYAVYPESGSGSLTITYSGGSSQSTAMASPSVWETQSGGSLQFSYTETWRYVWEPEAELVDDFPVDTVHRISGTVQWDFFPHSGAEFESGSASGSATMGGNSANASMSVAVGGSVTGQQAVGVPQQIGVDQALSGWDGTFQVTYSGSMTLSAVMVGTMWFDRYAASGPVSKFIYITSPRRGVEIKQDSGGVDPLSASVSIQGVWKNPNTSALIDYRVRLDPGNSGPLEDWTYISLPWYPSNTWNTWSAPSRWYGVRSASYQVNAALEYKDAAGNYVSGDPIPQWSTETRFKVIP